MVSVRRHARYWRTYLACGGLVLVFVLAISHSLSEKHKANHAYQKRHDTYGGPRLARFTYSPLVSGHACEDTTDEQTENLCIEERSAEATESQADWAAINFLIGLIGVGAVIATLIYTAQAANAAMKAAQIAESALIDLERPWVLLEAIAPMDGNSRELGGAAKKATGTVLFSYMYYFKNAGRTPAFLLVH